MNIESSDAETLLRITTVAGFSFEEASKDAAA
jgi:hypothetical protein